MTLPIADNPMSLSRVITIDGPSGSGKGTVSQLLAARLGWHFLDSGALYRVLGVAILERDLGEVAEQWAQIAAGLNIHFAGQRVVLDGWDVSEEIRSETAGAMASQVAAHPGVRAALLARQRAFARAPGLVADGRDMGTVVFPEAQVKIFLTATAEERAKRRYNQLKEKGLDVNLTDLAVAIRERDERDRNRSVAPLMAATAALEVESTGHSIDAVLEQVLERVWATFPDLRI
jgi:CMP/dCMP kinase